MDEVLTQLGLNAKEARFYLFLLAEGERTASQLSKDLGETRTNTYMVLNGLVEQGLVRVGAAAVKQYGAAEPLKLRELVTAQQLRLRQSQAALSAALPQLTSVYNLGEHKPGVIYLEGLKGYRIFLEDLTKTGQNVHLLGGNTAPQSEEARQMLQAAIAKRKQKGIPTQAIFHAGARNWPHIDSFAARGFAVRFWGEQPLDSEIVIYANKVSFTIYKPKLIVTVITNDVLALTFHTVFEQLWSQASD